MFLPFTYLNIFIHSCSKIANLSVHFVRLDLQQHFCKGENIQYIQKTLTQSLQCCILFMGNITVIVL